MPSLAERFRCLPAPSPADRLVVRVGALGDYDALAAFHYLADRPAVATRVLVMAGVSPTSKVESPRSGAQPWTLDLGLWTRAPAAVLVESLPSLGCVMRDVATGGRYKGTGRRFDALRLNTEVRCISRVVVDPRWRSMGLAVRLVKHALTTATTPYVEAIAAMGGVHPFFELAGMTAYRRHRLGRDQRLIDALRFAGMEPWELASGEGLRKALRFESPGLEGSFFQRELSRWAGPGKSFEEQIRLARQRLLREPVYYLWRAP